MANNIIAQLPFSVTGVKPGMWFLTSSEDYATLIAAGYLNSVSGAGIDFQPNDIIFAQYNDGINFGMFIVSVDGGVFSMAVYSPNSNSFIFSHVQFVAKGGSDLNAGTSMGLPKLTIGAAITALNPGIVTPSLVWILDNGIYDENVVLPNNIFLYGVNANLEPAAGDALTINDSGTGTYAQVTLARIESLGNAVAIAGPGSQMLLNCPVMLGNITNEGILELKTELLQNCAYTSAANSFNFLYINFQEGCTFTFDPASQVNGNIQTVLGLGNTNNIIYGQTSYNDHLIYQESPSTETIGRTVAIADSNTRIVYNNAADDNYTLPQTSDVAIPIGTNIEFVELGLGAAVFVAGAGVTIVSSLGALVKTNGAGAVARAWKYTDTIWILDGNLSV